MAETVAATAAETAAWAAAPAASKEGIRMIRMQGIRKEYHMGDSVLAALDGVDIHIKPHEFVSIIGPSGSGKSTLMNIIGCLDTPTSGEYITSTARKSTIIPKTSWRTSAGAKSGLSFSSLTCCPS